MIHQDGWLEHPFACSDPTRLISDFGSSLIICAIKHLKEVMCVGQSVSWLVGPSRKRLNCAKRPVPTSFFIPLRSHALQHLTFNVHSDMPDQRGTHNWAKLGLVFLCLVNCLHWPKASLQCPNMISQTVFARTKSRKAKSVGQSTPPCRNKGDMVMPCWNMNFSNQENRI